MRHVVAMDMFERELKRAMMAMQATVMRASRTAMLRVAVMVTYALGSKPAMMGTTAMVTRV